jgi:integrase
MIWLRAVPIATNRPRTVIVPVRAGVVLRIAKCQGRSVAAAVPQNFCCNFVNESKSAQNAAKDNQRRKLSSARRRTDLAENEDNTEAGVRDLKSRRAISQCDAPKRSATKIACTCKGSSHSYCALKVALKDGKRRFSDSTISYYFRIMRQVISSQMDEKFRPVHQREWNLAAIGLPRVNPKNQRRPTMTPKEMTTLLDKAEGQYLMIYFLNLVTGMRSSEVVAIEMEKHIEPDCSIIYVRQQRAKDMNALKSGLKTEAGLRDIDLHPDAARILRNFIGSRKSGFLFQTANGTMLDPGNIDRDSLSPILKEMGRNETGTRFNVFRRFREAVLQRSEARQILIDYWMGHSNPSMGDRYGKQLVEDVEYRQEQAKKVGLGFDLPPSLLGLRGLQSVSNVHNNEAA